LAGIGAGNPIGGRAAEGLAPERESRLKTGGSPARTEGAIAKVTFAAMVPRKILNVIPHNPNFGNYRYR
jgi:hypothetical protein